MTVPAPEPLPGAGGGGDLLAANNLSDVASSSTSRENLDATGFTSTDAALLAAVSGGSRIVHVAFGDADPAFEAGDLVVYTGPGA